jgi:hypothetical protein
MKATEEDIWQGMFQVANEIAKRALRKIKSHERRFTCDEWDRILWRIQEAATCAAMDVIPSPGDCQ